MKSRKRQSQRTESEKQVVPSTSPAKGGADNRKLWICVGLALITVVLYWRVAGFELVNFDDADYAGEKSFARHGLTKAGLVQAFTETQVGNWHPLTMMSLMLNGEMFGPGPKSFHVVNLLLHVINTVLVFLVFTKLTGALWRSAVVAALFAWHPLHVESVAWVSERKDVLSGMFWLLTMWAYVRYVQRARRSDYAWALVFMALGLMSKPMVVTLPFVLLLLDDWPLSRWKVTAGEPAKAAKSLTGLVAEKIPFFVLALLGSVVAFMTQQHTGAVAQVKLYPVTDRVINAVVSYARYLEKTVWPGDLAAFYPYPLHWATWRVGWSIMLLLAISLAVWLGMKRAPYLRLGWFWFLGTLVPVIGLVQVGSQSMADRYTYLPLLGIFVMMVWGVADAAENLRVEKKMLPVLTGLAAVGCVAVSWVQIGYWRDSVTLFEHAVQVTTRNEFAQTILGDAYAGKNQFEASLPHYREAIRLQSKDFDNHFHLASALAKLGRPDEAADEFLRVVELKRDHFESWYNLGGIFFQRGDAKRAAEYYTEAAKLKSDSADLEFNLATVLLSSGQLDPAAEHFAKALKLNPQNEIGRVRLGVVLSRLGKTHEALPQFVEALRINEHSIEAQYRLAWLLATDKDAKLRNGAEAVRWAERANAQSGGSAPALLDVLAAAYAEAGRFSEAVAAEQKAIALMAGQGGTETLRQRLALFQANQAYRAP